MILDLTTTNLFEKDTLPLDKDINFIFGKNGTGKSTITDLIRESNTDDFEVRIFQGFESVLGENEKLNAVVLGEENKKINQVILEKEKEILEIQYKITTKKEEIEEPKEISVENLFNKKQKALEAVKRKNREIERFYTEAASILSQNKLIIENARLYNKNNFKNDLTNAKTLDKADIKTLEAIIKTGPKSAREISFPKGNISKSLESVNEIGITKVQEKIIIEELQNNNEKLDFAQNGIKLHKVGDKCAFCGNEVEEDRFEVLKSYFSADEVIELKNRIEKGKQLIDKEITSIESLKISTDEFYPEYLESATALENELESLKIKNIDFLVILKNHLENKEKNLFEELETLELIPPISFEDFSIKYNDIMSQNNSITNILQKNKEDAKNKLRYHEVKNLVDNFQLEVKLTELASLNDQSNSIQDNIDTIEAEIESMKNNIFKLNSEISNLITKTQNTEKLAENINNKLKNSVTFKLIRKIEDKREFYEIKGPTGDIRSINELSTGEKNIIAFLYFMEKLNEISTSTLNKSKLIVFDDPMNSNDDTKQYLIIDELQRLIKKCQKATCSDKFILLTHNVFFYLNCSNEIKSRRDGKNAFEENNFYRLLSTNNKTNIIKISNKNEDFKTNYESLWHELYFLYNENKPDLMLNPIRRIIETFTIFNGQEDFYKNNKDAKNLFNTNSHYFPDLEADLNGKTRENIIEMMKQCFKSNNAEPHFNKHWKNAKSIVVV